MFDLQCGGKNIRLVVMNNLLPRGYKMHIKYDLKVGRFLISNLLQTNEHAILMKYFEAHHFTTKMNSKPIRITKALNNKTEKTTEDKSYWLLKPSVVYPNEASERDGCPFLFSLKYQYTSCPVSYYCLGV